MSTPLVEVMSAAAIKLLHSYINRITGQQNRRMVAAWSKRA